MNSMKKIKCVYSKNKLDFKKYSRCSDYQEVVSYYDIIAKLIKNDVDGVKPSDFVINSYIRKKLIKAIEDSDTILYALKNLDSDAIESCITIASEVYECEIIFELAIIDAKKNKIEICEDLSSRFTEVITVEYGQS